ncbi:hypothetical protein HMI56_003668 [Coelomomyces lativittatus]|nr:hypothetical protein HMI56_003668 [Coelomomyces lativittatus]
METWYQTNSFLYHSVRTQCGEVFEMYRTCIWNEIQNQSQSFSANVSNATEKES